MRKTISYGTTSISYRIEYRPRKTLSVEVQPDCTVCVIAPIGATFEVIQKKVERRASWIARQQRYFRGRPERAKPIDWVNGENMFYLGRQYRLKILKGNPCVKLLGRYLRVETNDKSDKNKIQNLVEEWYLEHARMKLEERLDLLKPMMKRTGLKMNNLIIRKLEKRWGSCTPKGNIVINAELIKAPIHCIDYVLIHEVCHLKFHHHGPEFWKLLNKHCPEWFELKKRLENFNF